MKKKKKGHERTRRLKNGEIGYHTRIDSDSATDIEEEKENKCGGIVKVSGRWQVEQGKRGGCMLKTRR